MEFVIQGALLGISAALSPGPFQSLIIAQSLVGGWRRALPITFAPLIGDIPIAIVLVFILKQVPTSFLTYIRFAGAALLIYLALNLRKQIKARKSQLLNGREPSLGVRRGLLMGLAMLLMSPGPYLYWSLILGPLLLAALAISLWQAIAFLAAFYLFSIGGLILISYTLGRLGRISQKLQARLQMLSLLLMLAIAGLLIADALII